MPQSEPLKLVAPSGAKLNLDTLIEQVRQRANESKARQEGQRKVLEGVKFDNTLDFQKAVTEVGISIGEQLALEWVVETLGHLRGKLVKE